VGLGGPQGNYSLEPWHAAAPGGVRHESRVEDSLFSNRSESIHYSAGISGWGGPGGPPGSAPPSRRTPRERTLQSSVGQ
jgi:hypothetical protein